MPQWAGSSWYELRYTDPHNSEAFCAKENEAYWMGPRPDEHGPDDPGGVDLYVGGVEHAVLHLLYSRFWHKVLSTSGTSAPASPTERPSSTPKKWPYSAARYEQEGAGALPWKAKWWMPRSSKPPSGPGAGEVGGQYPLREGAP